MIQPHEDVPLSEVEAGQQVTIRRVEDDDPDLLRYLADLNLTPQTTLRVVEVAPFGGPVHITVGDAEHALGADVAAQIFVTVD